MLLPKDIVKVAGQRYKELGSDVTPREHSKELLQGLRSTQVVALAEALCDAVNNELVELKRRIIELERELYAKN
jgi:hypothetical protein